MGDGAGEDRVLNAIYGDGLERSDWTAVCTAIRDALPDAGVAIHIDDGLDDANVGVVQAGFDACAVLDYVAHYAWRNPWLPGTRLQPIGALAHAHDHVPTDAFLRTEFWTDFLRPQGDFAGGSSVVLSRRDAQQAMVVLNYSHRHLGAQRDADAMLVRVAPHLSRAFALWRAARLADTRAQVGDAALGALGLPIVLLDGRRRVRFANDAADAILHRRDGVSLSGGEELHLTCREADAALGRALSRVLGTPRHAADPVTVRKSAPRWTDDAAPVGRYVLTVVPAPAAAAPSGFGSFSFRRGDLAMLVIHDTEACAQAEASSLRRCFDLTPTEADLAAAMAAGQTVAAYARAREVSRYTVRNQLGAVMRKTGTHRQADLLALLTRLSLAI